MSELSLWQQHCNKWGHGCGSEECEYANHVVLARGTLPCQVLFIGEAPGESEDVLGRPFVGPAGKLMDHIIEQALRGFMSPDARGFAGSVTYALTNLVCCIPRDEAGGKATEPDDEQVRQCQPRLLELVLVASPALIVCVGALARDWLDPQYKHGLKIPKREDGSIIPRIDITHPAAMLRANVAQKGLLVQKAIVTLQQAIEEYV